MRLAPRHESNPAPRHFNTRLLGRVSDELLQIVSVNRGYL